MQRSNFQIYNAVSLKYLIGDIVSKNVVFKEEYNKQIYWNYNGSNLYIKDTNKIGYLSLDNNLNLYISEIPITIFNYDLNKRNFYYLAENKIKYYLDSYTIKGIYIYSPNSPYQKMEII
jgi:hypothetical protein